MRRGNKADFDPSKMLPGEWAVAIDSDTQNQIVWMCFRAGVVKRMGTYEDFKEQIREATAEIKNEYKEEFQTILGEIEKLAEQTSENRNTVVQIRDDTVNTYLPKMLEYVKKAESSAEKAEASQQQTAESATKAQSYAVGGTGSRKGEDSDNAKYYSEQAKAIYGEMQKEQVTGVKGDNETEYHTGNVNLTPDNIGALPISGGKLTGQLQVGEKVKLYTSSEGGNIQIISPDDIGLRWELDAFKGDLRFICFNNDGTVKKICQLTKDGTLIANNATQSAAGLMSPKDKEKLDNLSDNVVAVGADTAENTTAFTAAPARENLKSGEKHNILFGKIAKWFADLKTVAFSGSYNDLSNKPTIPTVINNNTTTVAGYALDARQANPNVSGSMAAQMKSNYEPKLQIVSAASTAAELRAGATRTDTIIITIPTGYSFTGFVICDYNNNSGKTLTTIQTVTVSDSNVTVLVLLYNTSSGKSNTLARVKALMVKNI